MIWHILEGPFDDPEFLGYSLIDLITDDLDNGFNFVYVDRNEDTMKIGMFISDEEDYDPKAVERTFNRLRPITISGDINFVGRMALWSVAFEAGAFVEKSRFNLHIPSVVSETTAKKILAHFSEKQKHVWCCCPRCGCDRMAANVSRNALSRRVDLMICDICGNIEAIEDFPDNPKLPVEQWALNEHPDKFFLKGKDYNTFYFVFCGYEDYPFQEAYMIVEGFDEHDAAQKVIDKYWESNGSKLPYACYFSREEWNQAPEMRERFKYVGTLRLNGIFEEAE